MRVANRDIVSIVKNRAVDVEGYGNMWSKSTPNGIRRGGWKRGALPGALTRIMFERGESITQVIYSYSTPIAWLDAGQWIVPFLSYSPTTGKHQSYLRELNGEAIPWDCALDEYMRVLNAQMRFVQDGGRLITKPGHRWS